MERIVKGIWIPIEIWSAEDLSWNEKILLMEIDSYTSKGRDCFMSDEAASELLKVTRETANRTLSSLIKKGYVRKTRFDGRQRYVESCLTYVTADVTETSQQLCGKRHNTYNKITYKSEDKSSDNNITAPRFDFKKNLIGLGVSQEVAETWMAVRKKKRAHNSEIAFKRVKSEIEKSGLPAEECIRTACEKSWQGFEAAWLERLPQRERNVAPKKESALANNMRVADELFGTRYHEQAYGGQNVQK